MPLIVTPAWLGFPDRMGDRRAWGLATQLYSVRSAQSWGVGDLADLEDLAVWSGAVHGADYVLVNPLHAAEPLPPLEPSPYLPSSRRFANPLYLRPERIWEYAQATDEQRANVQRERREALAGFDPAGAIDRNRSWLAKRKALRVIFDVPRSPGRRVSFDSYRNREGTGLDNFALLSGSLSRNLLQPERMNINPAAVYINIFFILLFSSLSDYKPSFKEKVIWR